MRDNGGEWRDFIFIHVVCIVIFYYIMTIFYGVVWLLVLEVVGQEGVIIVRLVVWAKLQ
jgi:hypothetical protein